MDNVGRTRSFEKHLQSFISSFAVQSYLVPRVTALAQGYHSTLFWERGPIRTCWPELPPVSHRHTGP